ncbi:MAG TPA: PilN domain-containing protein [Candidatus Angelobacter sp.]
MIRINLSSLAPPKTKRGGKRAATPTVSMPGEGPSSLVMGFIFAALLAAGMVVSYLWVNNAHDRLEKELQVTMRENQRLAEVKRQYLESKKASDIFERRVKVIEELKNGQKAPVEMLNIVADTVNKTDAVWLDSMTSDGKNLDFVGMALSADAVADLMANLRKTGAFKSVEIKETAQDAAVKELQAFKFELICEIGFSSKVQNKS